MEVDRLVFIGLGRRRYRPLAVVEHAGTGRLSEIIDLQHHPSTTTTTTTNGAPSSTGDDDEEDDNGNRDPQFTTFEQLSKMKVEK